MNYRPFLIRRTCLIIPAAAAVTCGYRVLSVLPDQVDTGNTWESPDGRFRLDTWSRSGASVWGSRPDYYEFTLTNLRTRRVISRVTTDAPPGEAQIGYGAKSVIWNETDSVVAISIGGTQQLQLPLPQ